MTAFQTLLTNPAFKSNPMGYVSECVKNKIINEEDYDERPLNNKK